MNFKSYLRTIAVVFGITLYTLLGANSHAYYVDNTRDIDFSNLTRPHQLDCLALNIYHEGRGESSRGQAAIAAVTMNRVRSKSYPNSVCEVVWQKKQFSWTHIARRHHVVTDVAAWSQAMVIAVLFFDGARITKIGLATHYHADTVRPYWIADGKAIGKIGNHHFYIL